MKIKQINGNYISLPYSHLIQQHWDNPYNYCQAIAEQFENDFYFKYIKGKDLIVLDIGANIGLFSYHIMPLCKHIYCVEPTPNHNNIRNMVLYGYPVTNINIALSNHNGFSDFYIEPINQTMNSLQPRGGEKLTVPCMTLEGIFNTYNIEHIDLMKVDIEGSEHTAITVELLKPVADKIDSVWMEVHPPDQETQEKFAKVYEAVGFKVDKIHSDCLYCTK